MNNEEVTVSFHYLIREIVKDDDEVLPSPFTQDEFQDVYLHLKSLLNLDLSNEDICQKVRVKKLAPIDKVNKDNSRCITGVYRTSYSGHEFENSVKGTISADSLNLRPFFFMLYLSDDGKIYIGSQYLGNFGGYMVIKETIMGAFSSKKGIIAKSFNFLGSDLKKMKAKSIEISYFNRSRSIAGKNQIGGKRIIALERKDSKDSEFERAMERTFLAHLGKPPRIIRRAASELLKQEEAIAIADEDIQGCKLFIDLGKGRDKVLYLMDQYNYASKFPVDVAKDKDGHPQYAPLKEKVMDILKLEVIARVEDV